MFSSMNHAFIAKDLLSPGDADVVGKRVTVMVETDAVAGQGGRCQDKAASATVEVECEVWLPAPQECDTRDDDVVDIGVLFEERNERWLSDDGDAEIGPVSFEEMNGWCREDAVSE